MINATWKAHPHDGNYNDGGNWSHGDAPDGTATFGASSITSLSLTQSTSIGKWLFAAGAAHYKFDIGPSFELDVTGSGIVVQGGGVAITDENQFNFHSHSAAGSAHITVVTDTGELQFFDSSTAGKAVITNDHTVIFHDTSTASNAHITTNSGLVFADGSSAGKAHITNTDVLTFFDQSSAGSAVITTLGTGDTTFFRDNSTADHARLVTSNAGAVFDFSFHTGTITVGSIEGPGNFVLGANNITVGGNNLSTTVSGVISGVGASLAKVGTGTLTLSNQSNTYFGGTVLDSGTLDIAAAGAAGTGDIFFDNQGKAHATLKIENAALSGGHFATTIESFHNGGKIDLPGLKFVAGAEALYDPISGQLEIDSGSVSDTLKLLGPGAGKFTVKKDGHGGSVITLVTPHAKPLAANHLADAGKAGAHDHESFSFGKLSGEHGAPELEHGVRPIGEDYAATLAAETGAIDTHGAVPHFDFIL